MIDRKPSPEALEAARKFLRSRGWRWTGSAEDDLALALDAFAAKSIVATLRALNDALQEPGP